MSLPFDVAFILWGDVTTDKTGVTLQFAEVPENTSCASVPPGAYSRSFIGETFDWQASDYDDRKLVPPSKTPETDLLAPADGASKARLVATIAAGLASPRTVTITTSEGEFASSTTNSDRKTAQVTADSSNKATVELRSPTTVGAASLTASVADFASAYSSVRFQRADPDTVFVSANKATVARAGAENVSLTVTPLRDTGAPTTDAVVAQEARDINGPLIGVLSSGTDAGIEVSVGSRGESYDGLAETIIGFQDGGDSTPRPVAKLGGGGIRDGGLGRLVQPPALTRTERVRATGST